MPDLIVPIDPDDLQKIISAADAAFKNITDEETRKLARQSILNSTIAFQFGLVVEAGVLLVERQILAVMRRRARADSHELRLAKPE